MTVTANQPSTANETADTLVSDTALKVRQLRDRYRAAAAKLIADAKREIRDKVAKDAQATEAKGITAFLGVLQRHLAKDAESSRLILSAGAIAAPVGRWGWEEDQWIQLNEDGTLTGSWHDGTGLWDIRLDGKTVKLLPHGNRSSVTGEISAKRDEIKFKDGKVIRLNSTLSSPPPSAKPIFEKLVREVAGTVDEWRKEESEIIQKVQSPLAQAGLSFAQFQKSLNDAIASPDTTPEDRAFFVGKWKLQSRPLRVIELLEDGRTMGSWHNHWGMWTLGPDGTVSMMISAAVSVSQARLAEDKKSLASPAGSIFPREGP